MQVEFEVQETFQLVERGGGGAVAAGVTGRGEEGEEEGGQGAAEVATRLHFFTFESDFLRGTEPEWQVRLGGWWG